MAQEPENIVLVILREIRGELCELSDRVGKLETTFDVRVGHVEKRLDDLTKIVRYTPGQSTETQLRQAQQESPLFTKLEKLLSDKAPV